MHRVFARRGGDGQNVPQPEAGSQDDRWEQRERWCAWTGRRMSQRRVFRAPVAMQPLNTVGIRGRTQWAGEGTTGSSDDIQHLVQLPEFAGSRL